MTTQFKQSIDDILQSTAIGSLDKAIGNNVYGFNHEQKSSAVPYNKEQQGFVFFTRPQLNLQDDNVKNVRKFMLLASDYSNVSIHRIVRTLLDPRLMVGYQFGKTNIPRIESPLTNNKHAFIPILTNNITALSGWPDLTAPVFTSRQGRYNESISFVDGLVENYDQYTIDATFRNTVSDPILYMFYIWTLYASYVFQGKLVPYPDFIVNNRIDYNTRIFRIRLDKNRYKVTKIMSTGPAIPLAASVGEFGDLNMDETISSMKKDITIRFQCTGFELFDEKLIEEFNVIQGMFNPDMRDANRDNSMIMVPRQLNFLFQFRAYPRINQDSHVMEWWVDRSLFDLRTQAYIDTLNQTEQADFQEVIDDNTDE